MTPHIRMAVFASLMLLAGVARAASTDSTVPADAEKVLEAAQATVPYLDYASCPTPQAQQEVQIKAALQIPDEDRGPVIDKGGCAVASTETWPSKVDDRYSIGE